LIDRWNLTFCGTFHDHLAFAVEEWVGGYEQRFDLLFGERSDDLLDATLGAGFSDDKFQPHLFRRSLQVLLLPGDPGTFYSYRPRSDM